MTTWSDQVALVTGGARGIGRSNSIASGEIRRCRVRELYRPSKRGGEAGG